MNELEKDEAVETKKDKFVDIILKHRKLLNLNTVAEQILEIRKEKEKKQKKKEEKKKSILKMQDQTCKAVFHNQENITKSIKWKDSPKTAPHYLIKQKKTYFNNADETKTNRSNKNQNQDRFSIELQKFIKEEKMTQTVPNSNSSITLDSIVRNHVDQKKYNKLANNVNLKKKKFKIMIAFYR